MIESQCKGARNIFVLCTGAEDTTTGKSWCSDCVKGIMFYFFHYYLFNKETYLLCIRELIFPTRQSRVECIERSPVPFCLQLSLDSLVWKKHLLHQISLAWGTTWLFLSFVLNFWGALPLARKRNIQVSWQLKIWLSSSKLEVERRYTKGTQSFLFCCVCYANKNVQIDLKLKPRWEIRLFFWLPTSIL